MPAWVQVCRLDGTIELVNRAATQISGYPASELVGQAWPYPWLECPQGGSLPQVEGAPVWPYGEFSPWVGWDATLGLTASTSPRDGFNRHRGAPLEFEIACCTSQGETKPLSVTLSLLLDQEGQPEQVLLVAWDITRRKRLEAEMGQAQKIQAVNQLASGVAHDINNNLAVILGYSEYLLTKLEAPDPDVHQALSAILEQSKECADTVRRIQLFSRPVPRRQFTALDVNEVVREVVQTAQSLRRDGAHPEIRVETALGPLAPVQAHRASLREVLTSLVSNAVDALLQGGVISLRTWQTGDWVAVEVKDNGVGIPASDMGRMFEPFFTTKGPSRSGLGLSIAHNLISQQGGTIQVASQPGRGASFTVRLLAVSPEFDTPGDTPAAFRPAGELRNPLSILVVDDEPQVAGVLKTFLESLGHRVVVCPDGPTALETFPKDRFHLAVVDLGMPVMDGWELARRLNRQSPGFPILVATGWSVSEEDAVGQGAEIRAVVRKPFSLKELSQAVDRAVAVAR
jgi:signal transduction histidine kinase